MTEITQLQTPAAREALEFLEQAYAYSTPKQEPRISKDTAESDAYLAYFEAA
ncbi:hypothetical protein P775_05490 [Puniceibacterium antarcticum]|uniref:Uncharacterized protein n=1 Tax=Puniceibacterium antarcticum TaxID=1206336 RepID=A0A2G8RIM1_9RHOB|nr:hypothetical protein [Puniceibacterium antarcticum]PIL21251.1 hypothetical protein P775_05490 [Puniceibacterium antarcticum]